MSRSIDLFIDSPLSVAELAAELASLCHLELIQPEAAVVSVGLSEKAPTSDQGWRLADGDVVVELFEHDYIDDGTLDLSRYPYVLSAPLSGGAGPLDSPQALVLRRALETLRAQGGVGALLIFDLQYRLGGTAPQGGQ